MSLLTVQGLTKSYIGHPIFEDVGFQLRAGDRVGLIGPNGSGKTTLLRILAGEESADGGEIQQAKNLRIGYLPQDVHESLEGLLLPSVLDAVPGRVGLEKAIDKAEHSLKATHDEDAQMEISQRLAELYEQRNDLESRHPVHEAERILTGLGFAADEFSRPVAQLSGGWKMRAALAALLHQKPDLLLMDEPTNHLDIPSVHWLDGFLQNFPGAIILVCHDRDFLNRQVGRVISFEPEGVRSYSGDYDHYLLARAEERKTIDAAARKQEAKVKQAKRFIERFRAKASKARQAQSKLKLLRKLELIETHREHRTIHFSFPPVERAGRTVLSLQNIHKAYDSLVLYDRFTLNVSRGDRVAVIGPNGAGKTTLLRIAAGELSVDDGTVALGHNVVLSYYAQHQTEMLHPGNTVLEEVHRAVPDETIGYVRNVCGAFLFSGDSVDKKIAVLSGGEKARVALARSLVRKANFMVMDEPTNHLDLQSSEVLIRALDDYEGTLLFVSHNQGFVDRLATRIIDLRRGDVVEYPGSLYEYYDHLEREKEQAESPQSAGLTDPAREASDRKSRKEKKREQARKRARMREALRPIEKKIAPIEERIASLEAREKELQTLLADPAVFEDKEKGVPLFTEYGEVRAKLDELLARWEYLHERLEEARTKLEE